ncbi:flagellar motor switch protein FliN [Dyella solisilvae]|uniref:Flagellar motor switch protein FliN n=1 Tax=Dyella solisilvae TaxID=1920168 RepID=A0A370K9J5_9GAMM|nr:FliM/FliN family flagellar motor C-terminal domain-containing protein [Dyella solisilvae]RDI99311.1 flagellar motor switch protein FliN [Dyella solisilvae]
MNDIAVAPIELDEAAPDAGVGEPLIRRELSMLGHVNVQLDVHLGHAQVSVERLFSLKKGESITLDTPLDAPVTVQLDGKPVARGHLLAVGEHFGLKITEIL